MLIGACTSIVCPVSIHSPPPPPLLKARHAFIADKVRRCQKLIADAAAKKLVGKRAGGRSD